MSELKKILHVDDDQDIRTIAQMSLEMVGGFELKQCASGKEALVVAPKFRPDLLLLDVMMPEMTGEQLWNKLMQMPELANTPISACHAAWRPSQDATRSCLDPPRSDRRPSAAGHTASPFGASGR